MDVTFLSRMIGELILDHDSLSLPGLGTFVVEDMPASFSDRGYTVNPPYRRLSFSERESADGLLAELYASSNPVQEEEAAAIISAFVLDLKAELQRDKGVDLPGLGRLRATRENHIFFVPDEDLDISPEACGLEPVSLKSRRSATLPDVMQPVPSAPEPQVATQPQAVPEPPAVPAVEQVPAAEATAPEAPIVEIPAAEPTPIAEPAPAAEPEPAAEPAPAAKPEPAIIAPKPRRRALGWALGIAGAAAALLLAFVLASRLSPGSTDRLLYTQEELAIINAPEDGSGLPR
ncbi:MAG: hypothetical protein II053_07490 [Bacteroidales bacterium]|nr:hypothetical protein [Bacteroidales bacterium]MBQ4027194.1 hypothetical protein [Bacteroidales bacterium]